MSSNEPVSVNPDGLTNAANQFDAIADTTQHILNTLKSTTSSEGQPWGDDKSGKTFADGEKGYVSNANNTFSSLASLVGVFQQNASNLKDTVSTFEKNEADMSGSGGSSGS